MSLFRRLGGAGPEGHAGADDEHHQRRRARRQQRRHPGVHDPAGRRAELRRGAALRRGDLPHAQEGAARARAHHRRRRRGRLRARTCRRTRRRSRPSSRPSSRAGYKAGEDVFLGLDVASSEFFRDGIYHLESEGRQFTPAQFVDYLAGLVDKYPIITIEDGMAEGDWDGWALLTQQARAQACSWSATTCSSPTRRSCARASRSGIANSILIKPNQIGTLTETLAAIDMAADAGYTRGRLAPLGRDRGQHHRRHRGGDRAPRRSRPARCAAPTASPSTTSCCASRPSSARRRRTPAARRSRCRAGRARLRRPMMLRIVAGLLLALFLALQYRLWVSPNGMRDLWRTEAAIEAADGGERAARRAQPHARRRGARPEGRPRRHRGACPHRPRHGRQQRDVLPGGAAGARAWRRPQRSDAPPRPTSR